MATRGQIAYLVNANTIATTYIHYDAYPEYLGKTLDIFYDSDMEAKDLVMNGGSIRSIDEEGTVDRFNEGGAEMIKGEDEETLFSLLYDHSDAAAADYVYLWVENDWIALPVNKGREYFVGLLKDKLRNMTNENKIEEGTWSVMPERIPEFIKAVEVLKEEYHAVVGSDLVFDHLDEAIEAAKSLMSPAPEIPGLEGTRDALDALEESFVNKMKFRAGIIK